MHSWVAYRFMILINQLNADLEQVHGISEEDRSSVKDVIDELSRVVLELLSKGGINSWQI